MENPMLLILALVTVMIVLAATVPYLLEAILAPLGAHFGVRRSNVSMIRGAECREKLAGVPGVGA